MIQLLATLINTECLLSRMQRHEIMQAKHLATYTHHPPEERSNRVIAHSTTMNSSFDVTNFYDMLVLYL